MVYGRHFLWPSLLRSPLYRIHDAGILSCRIQQAIRPAQVTRSAIQYYKQYTATYNTIRSLYFTYAIYGHRRVGVTRQPLEGSTGLFSRPICSERNRQRTNLTHSGKITKRSVDRSRSTRGPACREQLNRTYIIVSCTD